MICSRCGAVTPNKLFCNACLIERGITKKTCRICGKEKQELDFPYRWNKLGEKVTLPVCRECTYKKAREKKEFTLCQFVVNCRKYEHKVCLNDYLTGKRQASRETIDQILEFISGVIGKTYIYDGDRIHCNGVTCSWGDPQGALTDWKGLRRFIESEQRGEYVRKLTKKDVNAIKRGLLKGVKYKDLAERYNVSVSLIGKIKRGER